MVPSPSRLAEPGSGSARPAQLHLSPSLHIPLQPQLLCMGPSSHVEMSLGSVFVVGGCSVSYPRRSLHSSCMRVPRWAELTPSHCGGGSEGAGECHGGRNRNPQVLSSPVSAASPIALGCAVTSSLLAGPSLWVRAASLGCGGPAATLLSSYMETLPFRMGKPHTIE